MRQTQNNMPQRPQTPPTRPQSPRPNPQKTSDQEKHKGKKIV